MKTTFLELRCRGQATGPAPIANVTVVRQPSPSVEQYRHWYRTVGAEWNWQDRLRMEDRVLADWLALPDVEVWLLQVDGESAGYCELDCRTQDVEIVYFGLFPSFVGRGLGRWFLQWTIERGWSAGAHRIWLHTCEQDHPAAMPNYLKAGFVVFKVEND